MRRDSCQWRPRALCHTTQRRPVCDEAQFREADRRFSKRPEVWAAGYIFLRRLGARIGWVGLARAGGDLAEREIDTVSGNLQIARRLRQPFTRIGQPPRPDANLVSGKNCGSNAALVAEVKCLSKPTRITTPTIRLWSTGRWLCRSQAADQSG
jgi:hypothetical protein